MSTYYKFGCKQCKVQGGFFSRQAWGWGNFDIIESFKFIAYHTSKCGPENIIVLEEQYDEGFKEVDKNFYEKECENLFPHSNDWSTHDEQFKKYCEHKNKLINASLGKEE